MARKHCAKKSGFAMPKRSFTMPSVGSVSDALGKDGFHVRGIETPSGIKAPHLGTPKLDKGHLTGVTSLFEGRKKARIRSALEEACV
jgi:hypothetical protein